ncbi:MAG: hypothetical protein WBB07_11965 [Mycobacterium sp.]
MVATVGCSSDSSTPADAGAPASDGGWVEDNVTFDADGLTIHGTYRHRPQDQPGPAALLISESGQTDRNGDNAVAGPVGNMRQLATFLSDHDVASLRYDKIGTGVTGLGPYAERPQDVGSAVYTSGAGAAIRFLAGEPGTDKERVSVYALGEGTTHAMALATSTDPGAPLVHSLALLQPLTGRYLDLITSRVRADNAAQLEAGSKTPEQAEGVLNAWLAAVAQVRNDGTLPAGQLPDGLSAILNPGNVKAVAEQDAIDPLALAASVPGGTPVLLTCSDSDGQASCADIKPLAAALEHTKLTLVELEGVNHVLRDDPTDNVANYASQDPLSPQLTDALDKFVRESA